MNRLQLRILQCNLDIILLLIIILDVSNGIMSENILFLKIAAYNPFFNAALYDSTNV